MRIVGVILCFLASGCGGKDANTAQSAGNTGARAGTPNDRPAGSEPIPNSGSGQQSASEDTSEHALAVADESQVPPCTQSAEGRLIYVKSTEKFRTCSGGTWQDISIKGEKGEKGEKGDQGSAGKSGDDGHDGADGSDNHIVSSIHCGGSLQGTTSLSFSYSVALLASGDLFANGSIYDGNFEVSNTAFYAREQNGATTGGVIFNYDMATPSNGGYWKIELNRTTLVTTLTYTDDDVAGGKRFWYMTPDDCIVNKY